MRITTLCLINLLLSGASLYSVHGASYLHVPCDNTTEYYDPPHDMCKSCDELCRRGSNARHMCLKLCPDFPGPHQTANTGRPIVLGRLHTRHRSARVLKSKPTSLPLEGTQALTANQHQSAKQSAKHEPSSLKPDPVTIGLGTMGIILFAAGLLIVVGVAGKGLSKKAKKAKARMEKSVDLESGHQAAQPPPSSSKEPCNNSEQEQQTLLASNRAAPQAAQQSAHPPPQSHTPLGTSHQSAPQSAHQSAQQSAHAPPQSAQQSAHPPPQSAQQSAQQSAHPPPQSAQQSAHAPPQSAQQSAHSPPQSAQQSAQQSAHPPPQSAQQSAHPPPQSAQQSAHLSLSSDYNNPDQEQTTLLVPERAPPQSSSVSHVTLLETEYDVPKEHEPETMNNISHVQVRDPNSRCTSPDPNEETALKHV